MVIRELLAARGQEWAAKREWERERNLLPVNRVRMRELLAATVFTANEMIE